MANHEYKSISFRLDEANEDGVFSGYASVFGNIDCYGDVVEPGAFTKTIVEDFDRIKILSDHNSCALPIGKPLELREDDHGLFLKAKISDTQAGRDIRQLMLDGVLCELSIGYDAIDWSTGEDGIRHLNEIKLWEISVVTWAANDQALINDVKSMTDSIKAEAKAGKLNRRKINKIKPFLEVILELAEIVQQLPEEEQEQATQAMAEVIEQAEAPVEEGEETPPKKKSLTFHLNLKKK